LRSIFLASCLLLACDNAEPAACPAGTRLDYGVCATPKVSVRVNTVGFVAGTPKQATYAGPAATFVIRSADDDQAVFPDVPGTAGPAIDATDSGEPELHVVDFSDLNAPGEYYVDVAGVGTSEHFRIADDVFVDAFHAAMLGMYGWRCGTAVSFEWQGQEFGHGACHLADGPAVAGWHDAGDYGKYTNNGAFSLGVMLLAWDHFRDRLENVVLDVPEQDNGIPDYLDECAYQLRWLFGMQLDDGSVSDRITAANFDPLTTMPEASNAPRRMSNASTKATADFAAVAAHAARIYREFDPDLAMRAEQAATNAWQFLTVNTTPIQPPATGFTGSYSGDPDTDDRFWAAAEIFETTGDTSALGAFEQASTSFNVAGYWDWDNVANLGIFTYLGSTREERSDAVVTRLTLATENTATNLASTALSHPYGRSLGTAYNWGVNGTIARTALALVTASRVDPDNAESYLGAVSQQLGHLFGRNFYGRSFVTGVGKNPPLHPHHRPSIADGIEPPWPGLLVGGPSKTDPAPATVWLDDENDYTSNEVAINWNAPLIYALAAFLPAP
jgi:endoglucanase